MRYYKRLDSGGKLISIGTGAGGVEITAEEYAMLADEINQKAALVTALADGSISATDIREDWRDEIVRRAAEKNENSSAYTREALEAMTNAELEIVLASMGVSANMNKANMVMLILAMQDEVTP